MKKQEAGDAMLILTPQPLVIGCSQTSMTVTCFSVHLNWNLTAALLSTDSWIFDNVTYFLFFFVFLRSILSTDQFHCSYIDWSWKSVEHHCETGTWWTLEMSDWDSFMIYDCHWSNISLTPIANSEEAGSADTCNQSCSFHWSQFSYSCVCASLYC